MLARGVRRDDGVRAVLFEPIAQRAGIVGAVREQTATRLYDVEDSPRAGQIMDVARREHESDRPAEIVGQGMDFRRAPAARGANGVMMSPPFAPAAERCALMWVESTLPVKTTDLPVSA
jgi:hypothetical protein